MSSILTYIIIFGVAAISIYILYRMIKKRQASTPGAAGSGQPTYVDVANPSQTRQLQSIENLSTGSGLTTVNLDPTMDNSLRNFCIKASFNSAYTGSYVNLDMVRYVISRGCRFLDFEVFIKDGIPIVAYSNATFDPSYTRFTSLAPAVSLDGVLSTVMANSFAATAPNPGDPIFIQLHINTYLQDGYAAIAQTIASTCSQKVYQGVVSASTQLSDLMGKIVFIVDLATSPAYQSYSSCNKGIECLANYIGMESGTSTLRTYTQAQLTNQATTPVYPDNPTAYLMRIILPNSGFFWGVQNSDAPYLIQNYGAQIIAQAFYVNDGKLAVYEDFFRNFQSAFVPLAAASAYIQQQGP